MLTAWLPCPLPVMSPNGPYTAAIVRQSDNPDLRQDGDVVTWTVAGVRYTARWEALAHEEKPGPAEPRRGPKGPGRGRTKG